jgi:hypothetical protein
MNRLRALVLLTALVCAAVAVPAMAGKGGNGKGNGSTAADSPSIYPNDASPALGSELTFGVTYPNSARNPRVDVRCYQGDTLVYGEAGGVNHVFVLGGFASDWKTLGGPASCAARLFDLGWNGNNVQVVTWLAATSFDAAG